jgi:hypothetical protein
MPPSAPKTRYWGQRSWPSFPTPAPTALPGQTRTFLLPPTALGLLAVHFHLSQTLEVRLFKVIFRIGKINSMIALVNVPQN